MAKHPRGEKRRTKKRKERERRLARERHQRRSGPVRIEDLPEERPTPPRFLMERALRGMRMGPGGPALESPDIAQARIDALLDRAAREPDALDDGERREAAQELAYRAMEARSMDEALEAAFAAFALDMECVDALVTLAVLCETDEERIQALEGAVAVGERRLGGQAFFDEHRGHFWGLVETRPYMRARQTLALTLQELGRGVEAAAHYAALLELNPDDNQGVRDVLVALHLELGDLVAARELLARFPEDPGAVHAWAAILERFLAGDRRAAARGARLAARDNPYVQDVLAGHSQPRQRDDGYYQPHTQSEAAVVDDVLWNAWASHPEAMRWLREGATTTTAEERGAAVASYRSPIAELLGWGEPELEGEASAQFAADLGREHLPELIRMASDMALSEMDDDAPEVWAPIHAIRAVARLRPPGAVEPLLGLVLEGFSDEELIEELIPALTRIGSPGLPALVRVLDDFDAPGMARMVAAEVLDGIVTDDPDTRTEVVAAQARVLRRYSDNPGELNAMIVENLASAGAVKHRELMREAFDAHCVSRSVVRSWEEIEEAFELSGRPFPRAGQ